jgi:K+-transporting ATPase ATPase C chain
LGLYRRKYEKCTRSIDFGSALLGQEFLDSKYFWGRPSATATSPYNVAASSGTNIALSNPAFQEALRERLQKFSSLTVSSVPVDLVTASGSGLDPHISVASAHFQARRISESRHVPLKEIHKLISKQIEKPSLGFLGEARVNVLLINMELDKL